MGYYKYVKAIGDGAIILKSAKHGEQVWTLCKLRKDNRCVVAEERILKGDEAYRPVTNGYNRMERISKVGMSILKAANEGASDEE